MKALVEAVHRCPNITFHCGKRTTSISESSSSVTLTFSDGSTAHGDLLLGCDGIHSVARTLHVEPSRQEIYSGIANAFGFASLTADASSTDTCSLRSKLHFNSTAINFARRGMLLTSYYEPSKSSIYVGGLLEIPTIAENNRNGWKALGADQAATKAAMAVRFATPDVAHAGIPPLIAAATDWFLWPVFTLPAGGKWCTGRTMLLGDAAHAMPPQGEATGIVLEDTVLFARCVALQQERGGGGLVEAFARYEGLRRTRIEAAFGESLAVVKTVKDAGAVGHRIKCLIVPWFLWWTRAKRERHFVEDVTTCSLEVVGNGDEDGRLPFIVPAAAAGVAVLGVLLLVWNS